MNKLTIIGNLTAEPVTKVANTSQGPVNLTTFTVAVNDRKGNATFFACTAWRGLGDVVAKFAHKGKKVCVVGPASSHGYKDSNGNAQSQIDVTAEDVEFLSPADSSAAPAAPAPVVSAPMPVDDPAELPF